MDESEKIDPYIIKKHANVLIDEEIHARIDYYENTPMIDQSWNIWMILQILWPLESSSKEIESRTIYQLAVGEKNWDSWTNKENGQLPENRFYEAIDMENADIVPLIAVNRLIDHIKKR